MLKDGNSKENHADEYTKAIGEIGRWQMGLYLLTAFPARMVLSNVLFGIIYMAPKTTYRCVERENSTEGSVNMTCYNDCMKYEYYSEFESTIIEQWDLICDRAWLADFAQTVLMFGFLIGSGVFGFISDRYGRRLTLIIAGTLQSCASFVMPFCPDLWSFNIVRFLLGVASGGTMIASFVYLMEILGPKKRNLLGSVLMLPITIGNIITTVIAFYFRTWRSFSVGMAIPTLLFLLSIFYLPESPKWLISANRLDEACVVMKTAAKWNNLPTTDMHLIVIKIAKEGSNDKKSERKATFMDLVTLPSLRIKSLCSCLIWFTSGLAFFGSYQYFGQTSSNVFLSFVSVGLVQFPGFLMGGYFGNVFGKRIAISIFLVINCVGNGILALSDEWYYVKMTVGTIGVSCGSAVLSILYVYTIELFPTVIRNMGVSVSCIADKAGSMVAPFIGGLRVSTVWLPPAVFAVAPIFGLIACWCLPETRGKKLEDNLDEN